MNKKYYYRIKTTYTTEDQWTATILLCCKVKKRVVSEEVKTALGGFETQMAAEKGLSQQLKSFQESAAIAKAERAKIRLENRAKKREHAEVVRGYSFLELESRMDLEADCAAQFKMSAELLWQDIAFRVMKNGAEWEEAYSEANSVLGPKLSHWRSKAKTGELDLIAGTQLKKARENAKALAQKGAESLKSMAEKQKFTGLKLVP